DQERGIAMLVDGAVTGRVDENDGRATGGAASDAHDLDAGLIDGRPGEPAPVVAAARADVTGPVAKARTGPGRDGHLPHGLHAKPRQYLLAGLALIATANGAYEVEAVLAERDNVDRRVGLPNDKR